MDDGVETQACGLVREDQPGEIAAAELSRGIEEVGPELALDGEGRGAPGLDGLAREGIGVDDIETGAGEAGGGGALATAWATRDADGRGHVIYLWGWAGAGMCGSSVGGLSCGRVMVGMVILGVGNCGGGFVAAPMGRAGA